MNDSTLMCVCVCVCVWLGGGGGCTGCVRRCWCMTRITALIKTVGKQHGFGHKICSNNFNDP